MITFDEFVLTKLPHFIAVNYQRMLEMETAKEKIQAALHVYDLGLRTLTLSLVSQYLTRDRERISDSYLNQLLLDKLPRGSLGTWQHLLFTTLRAYEGNQDVFFMSELYDFYWDTSITPHQPRLGLEEPFTRLTQIRNDLEYGLSPTDTTEWNTLLDETLELLKEFINHFVFIENYELIRIIDQKGQTYTYERHVGLTITQHQLTLPQIAHLESGWFYLSKQNKDFLLLDPLLIFWEAPSLSSPTVVDNDWDTAVFERFTYNQLQYLLSKFKGTIEDDGHVAAFVQLIFDTIREIKQAHREIEKLTWWQFQEVARDISRQRMATVQEKYNPNLYLQRNKVKSVLDEFLLSEKRGFILVGKSGVGKSNFILALADEFGHDHHNVCLLMYDAANLNPEISLTGLITQNFNDYLRLREREVENIWHEVAEIDDIEERTIVLCIDAINENPQGQTLLRQINELIQEPWPWLKVIITSRPEAWLNIKYGVKLAERLFYREPRSDKLVVEMEDFTYSQRLEPFSEDELPQVYEKYRQVYQVQTKYEDLPETVKLSLRDPLVLWLTANIYQQKTIPTEVKTTDVIPDYIEAMLNTGRLEHRDVRFLKDTLMPLMVREGYYANSIKAQQVEQAGQKLFELINVESVLSDGRQVNQSFVNLMDTEVLVRRGEAFDYEITFKYERFYDYFAGLVLAEIFNQVEDRYQLYVELVEKTRTHPFLWGAIKSLLLKDLQKDKNIAIPLTQSSDYFVRELVTAALIDLGKDYREEVVRVTTGLISADKVSGLLDSFSKWMRRDGQDKSHIKFGKLTAIEVASQLTIKSVLLTAVEDSDQDIRVAAIQQIYHLLTLKDVDLVFSILDELAARAFVHWYSPSFRAIEGHITISLLILFNYFEDQTVIANLQSRWNGIISRVPFFAVRPGSGVKAQVSSKVRNLIINIVVTFLIRAIRQIDVDEAAIVSLEDLESSFRQDKQEIERLKRVTRYIDIGYGSINDIRDDLVTMACTRDLLTLYGITMIFFAHFLTEKNTTIPVARECFYVSLSQAPPTPFLAGITLASSVKLMENVNKFDEEMWTLFKEMQNELYRNSNIVAGYNKSYSWGQPDVYQYYHFLHIGEEDPPQFHQILEKLEIGERWIELKNFISFFTIANLDHGLNRLSILKISSFLDHRVPSVRTTAIQSLASLRSKYPVEIDEFMKESKIPIETKVLIENHRVHQNLGMIFTMSLYNFWTRAIQNKDDHVISFIFWVADYIGESDSLRQWLVGIISRLVQIIHQRNKI